MSVTMTGPLAAFLQGLAFALVVGSLFVIVHALGRRVERWRWPWVRWAWVVLAAEYVLSFAALFIFKDRDVVLTVFGVSYVTAIVVVVAYLLRVVFPPPKRDDGSPSEPGAVGTPVAPAGSGAEARDLPEEDL
ncbi:hypothetical protein MX659_00195 [Coriobacteriia bacterium Es71-Z0120]|uniref:hypothetical protein n=1 Tax=Parvivirga hydrogeniphila TaxID=2939460 RepID=UPI00226084A2|nr:hypothetical protein [Parvivirga hydrogeniphila]MCL4078035.1 hypothetical protein [Parvivirga hydrogeniphila]